jgi:hypothetical protein
MYHDETNGRTPLWPSAEAEATCYTGHPAPSPGCRCGIYGAVAGTLDSLPGYLRDTAYERDPWAYAEIACSGRVFADMRGVRAERARLVRIALPGTDWPGEAAPREASRMLRDRYGVEVGGAGYVPQWLTANVRPGGAPPDGESLNLDLARLDLSCQGGLQGLPHRFAAASVPVLLRPAVPDSTPKLRSYGRSRRLRLSSAKPGKPARARHVVPEPGLSDPRPRSGAGRPGIAGPAHDHLLPGARTTA